MRIIDDLSIYCYVFDKSNEELEEMLEKRELPGYIGEATAVEYMLIEEILRMRKEAAGLREKYPMEVLKTLPKEELGKLLAFGRDYQCRVICAPVLQDIVKVIRWRKLEEMPVSEERRDCLMKIRQEVEEREKANGIDSSGIF